MHQTPIETIESRAVRLSGAVPIFARVVGDLVLSLRRAMGVPDQAEPEVEAEFAALRATLDEQFRPEFDKMYAGLLAQHLGKASTVVLNALESAPVQAYLEAAGRIQLDVQAALREYAPKMASALTPSA
jgi:hypothetical protein